MPQSCPAGANFVRLATEHSLDLVRRTGLARRARGSQIPVIGTIGAADRAALLRKYRALAEWRRVRDGGAGAGPDRAALRALSQEFPGALRELDVLGHAELSRRIAALGEGSDVDGERLDRRADDEPPWIRWILAYHRLMRAALVAKRAAGRTRRLSPDALTAVMAAAGAAPDDDLIDEAFILATVHPPGGRLGVVVLRALARRFGVPAARISVTLFPPRRAAPYALDD